MHIPNSMLHGAICPVTATVSALAVSGAAVAAWRCREKPTPTAFACVSSMIFGVQMLNFPINHGTSGHILGCLLAVSLLGVPFAILSMTIVLSVQALFFGDGGLNTLGANIINMAVVGAGLGGLFLNLLKKQDLPQNTALAIASWTSVVLASAVCSIELAVSGTMSLSRIFPAMTGVHALIGLGEALGTVMLVSAINKAGVKKYALASLTVAFLAVLASPWASRLPDGLQWASGAIQASTFNPGPYSNLMAALWGISLVFVSSFVMENIIKNISLTGGRYARR